MLSVAVFCLEGADASIRSVQISGQTPFVSSSEGLAEFILKTEADAIHIVPTNAIILPCFYQACRSTMEFNRLDYVETDYMSLPRKRIEHPQNGNPCQFLVKSWVFKEHGFATDLYATMKQIRDEYRGQYIPKTMSVEI